MIRSASIVVALAACSTSPEPTLLTQTGATLSVDYFGDTDVVGMHFQIDAVSCGGDSAILRRYRVSPDLRDRPFSSILASVRTVAGRAPG